MPGNHGLFSYFIWGEQSSFDVVTASMVQIINEFISSSLVKASTPIIPERIHNHPSPVEIVPGMINAEGNISMHMHADSMLFALKHWMHATSITSTDFTPQEILTATAVAAAMSLTTQPAATGTPCDPCKLVLTFSVAQASGTAIITGTDQNGFAISEMLTMDGNTEYTTSKVFQTVDTNGIALSAAIITAGGTLQINGDKDTYTHVMVLGDCVDNGFTVEFVKGDDCGNNDPIPNTYIGMIINEGELTLADTMTFNFDMMGKTANLRKDYQGNATQTDISGYSRPSQKIFPGWGFTLTLDAVQIDVESASLRLSNNLVYPDRYGGTRPRRKPMRNGDRQYTVTANIDYDTENPDIDTLFESGNVVAATLNGICLPFASHEYSFSINLGRCESMQYGDPGVARADGLLQTVSLRPVRSVNATSSDEMTVTVVSTESASWDA